MNYRSIGFCMAFGALAACSTAAEIPVTPTGGNAFTRALTQEYNQLSAFEADQMYDWIDADHFARKAILAAKGELVLPDKIESRDLPEQAIPDVTSGHDRLLAAFDAGARDRLPEDAARAQASFDCWIEQQEEDFQFDHIAACRDDFMTALNALEYREVAEVVPEPEPAPIPMAQGPFLVFFDWDRSDITPEAWDTLRSAADVVHSGGVSVIQVTGHADRSGSDTYNVGLSQRRADAVEAALAQLGIDAAMITTDWKGESDPLVETADGVREAQNRRVEIVLP